MANLGIFIPPVILAIAGYFVIRCVKKNPPKYLKYTGCQKLPINWGLNMRENIYPAEDLFLDLNIFSLEAICTKGNQTFSPFRPGE
ncbi:MAG: hypothetical protein GTO45_05215 [Candidatus Aminicenantes bacterium]|nr:hypothetical protein [Candidatus Aminicenantes bacterium]NIM78151.1 hypothetical protein [Candidatus Aminicenantes bacterium]NIN17475.1 hypothetical protein [Candidatus Aminicenantes bacterium]NIN41371.1 hypothetical protein [Candidatus Aminicenantes bacterium]NIN84137.1 hypothetical protein [Candidatus Aminicenantes bacterium]